MYPNQPNQPGQNLPPPVQAQAQSPLQASDYLHPITEPPKSRYHPKRTIILISVGVILCLAAVGIMIALAIMPTKTPNKPAAPATQPAATTEKALTAKETVEHMKVYFKGQEAVKYPLSLPVRAPGKNFYTVVPEVPPVIGIAGTIKADSSSAQVEALVKSLEYDKFTKQVIQDGSSTSNQLANFSRKDVVCQINLQKQTDPKADLFLEAKCLDMAVYTDYANAQQPLINLYTPLTATSVEYGFIGKPSIKNGATANYHVTELQVSTVIDNNMMSNGKYAVFYQTPDGLWHYFRDRDNTVMIECEQYNTQDLYAVFAGQACRSLKTGAPSTVPAPKKPR